MNNNISLSFGTPEYGWLPFDFRYNDFQIKDSASNVLNDPIEEIIYATTQLQNNETKRITWWLEAPAYYFDITKNDNNYNLTIYYSDDLFDKVTPLKLLKTIEGNEEEIIEPFRLALKQFETLEFERSHWYYEDWEEE